MNEHPTFDTEHMCMPLLPCGQPARRLNGPVARSKLRAVQPLRFLTALVTASAAVAAPGVARAQHLGTRVEPVVMVARPDVRGPPAAGVLLNSDGLVLTSAQYVARYRSLTVYLTAHDKRTARVVATDDEGGLALLLVGRVSGQRSLPLYDGRPLEKGAVLNVRGMEGGLPWQQAAGTVVSTQTGVWGNLAAGFLTVDGEQEGTGADMGAAVLAPDGSLAGVHIGRMRVEGAPTQRFVAAGVDRIRAFLRAATTGLPVARFCVRGQPQGATLWVDGKPQGALPAQVTGFEAGWHTLRVTAPGHLPKEVVMAAGVEEGACQVVALEKAPSITFRTGVRGLTLRVDGGPPLPLTEDPLLLPVGPHRASITAGNYRDYRWEGTLADGDALRVNVTMVRRHGLFNVRSDPPGAQVWVGGRLAGTTPLVDLKLAPGNWPVELKLPHYHPLQMGTVSVADTQTVNLGQATLLPLPARLTLSNSVVESGDEVYLNGHRVTGTSWKVQPGYHEVIIRRSWHSPGTLRLHVEPDEEKVVAPRPEALPEARIRRLKLLGGALGVVGAVAALVGMVALVAGGVAALVGSRVVYLRYLNAVEPTQLRSLYGVANTLVWTGVLALMASTGGVLAAGAAAAGSVWAFLTLPSDPSNRIANDDKAPAPQTPDETDAADADDVEPAAAPTPTGPDPAQADMQPPDPPVEDASGQVEGAVKPEPAAAVDTDAPSVETENPANPGDAEETAP